MTEADARQGMLAGCEVVYNGVTYRCIKELVISYDRKKHKFVLFLLLEEMYVNRWVRVPGQACRLVPL